MNHKLIDYFIPANSPWKFVRTKVLGFEPGNPKGCPHNVFPEPPENTELILETKTSVAFGDYGYYVCKNESRSVTEDGLKYKLKCLTNGRFQNRHWLTCRERGMCTKRPVLPAAGSGLGLSESRNVLEFDYANYTCQDSSQVLTPPTEDNIFRVLCKRKDKRGRNNFDQSVKVNWPKCTGKPLTACDVWSPTLTGAPEGYKLKEDKVSYINHGEKVEFVCEKEGFLAGEVPSISYKCNNQSFALEGFDSPPQCRKPVECPMTLPGVDADLEMAGLKKPQLLKPLKESESLEYACTKTGWSLFGNYLDAKDFIGLNSSSPPPSLNILDGKLKLTCKKIDDKSAGIETLSSWPKCRDENVKQCLATKVAEQVGSKWQLTGLTTYQYTTGNTRQPSNDPVNVGEHIVIACANDSLVNEAFKEKSLKCQYDGTFEITDEFKACKSPASCPSDIMEDKSKPWEDKSLANSSSYDGKTQFEIVKFECTDNKTLAGLQTTASMSPGYLEDGMFKLPCKLDVDGKWTIPSEWPTCSEKTTACTTSISDDPSIDSTLKNALDANFVTTHTVPINVSSSITYRCKTPGYVTADGDTIDIRCTESGKFDIPNPIPSCREPVLCEDPPLVPQNSRLMNSTSTGVKEWENAVYSCRHGTNLSDAQNFTLQCGGNGYYNKNPSFPTCNIIACVDVPELVDKVNIYKTDQDFVPIGEKIDFSCTDSNKFPRHDASVCDCTTPVQLECKNDGSFGPISGSTYTRNDSTWPACENRLICDASPVPDPTKGLFTNSTELYEFDEEKYYCIEGRALPSGDPYFPVQCGRGTGSKGVFDTASITWPICDITHCLLSQVGSGDTSGFNATTQTNPAVGETVSLKCATTGQVTDDGSELGPFTCGNDGNFTISPALKTCRDPVDCSSSIPTPSETSNLQNTATSSVKEFAKLKYNCETNMKLDNGKNYHEITVPNACNYGTINWPTCTLACDGNVATPPAATNLKVDSYTLIRPDNQVSYSCEAGYTLENVTLENDDGDTMTIDNGKLKLKCNASAVFPTPTWPNCTSEGGTPSGRKKRSTDRYAHLQDDIDYTIMVLVETQFMWTDGIEHEINSTTNKTREDRKEFPSKMIEHYHTTLDTALGPEDPDANIFNVNSIKIRSQTIRPLCEQPINYNYEIINAATLKAENENPAGLSDCIPSGSKSNQIYLSFINICPTFKP